MIKRKFLPGSEWVYFKIYTGVKTADIILSEAILPLINLFFEKKIIKKWFFIRYNDPKPHLRIRFELFQTNTYNMAIEMIHQSLQKYIDSGEISNVLLDTYNREIERYDETFIEKAEFLFFKNSQTILNEYLNFDDKEKIMISIFEIDRMLEAIGLSVETKMKWIKNSNLAFKNEFNADKKLNSQLDKKYRDFKIKYMNFLTLEEFEYYREKVKFEINDCRIILDDITAKADDLFLQSFFGSIFHMNINRIFISNQRLFEMIIYDYLYRYYKSIYFLSKQS